MFWILCLIMEESNKLSADDSADSSSESVLTDEWQELCKSDYAKVIFCYLFYDATSGNVECKFQITDNVHEDPCDFVGLYRIGYENLSQCIASKLLSETKCEDDGKLQHCIFNLSTLPLLEDGFYQFLYVTRDKEVCGASMPFEIKRIQNQTRAPFELPDDFFEEKTDDDFLLVDGIEKKNQLLEDLVEKYRKKNENLMRKLKEFKFTDELLYEDEERIRLSLNEEISNLKSQNSLLESQMSDKINIIEKHTEEMDALKKNYKKIQQRNKILERNLDKNCEELLSLHKELTLLKNFSDEHAVLLSDKQNYLEQLEDQLCMIKALEDSKQLAMKEMADLSESLSMRTHVLNCTRTELAQCKTKLKDATLVEEKQNEEIKKLCKEVNDLMQVLGEKEDALTTQTLKIEILENEIQKLKNELKPSTAEKKSTKLQKESETETKSKRTSDNSTAVERLRLFEEASNKIKEEVSAVIRYELARGASGTEIHNHLVEVYGPGVIIDSLALIPLSSKNDSAHENYKRSCRKLETMDKSNSKIIAIAVQSSCSNERNDVSSVQDSKSEECRRKKESKDVSLDVKEKEQSDGTAQENSNEDLQKMPEVSDIIPDVKFQIMTELNTPGIRTLDMDDVAAVNRMTQRVVNKYAGLSDISDDIIRGENFGVYSYPYSDSEYDSNYEPDSNDEPDFFEKCRRRKSENYSLRRKFLCIERIVTAMKDHLDTTNDWSHMFTGYNMEYAALPPKQQISLLLDKCKTRYQMSVLIENFEKHKKGFKKMCRDTRELWEESSTWTKEEAELKSSLAAKEAELINLKEGNISKNAAIDFLTADKMDLLLKEKTLQETVKDYAARLAEAAEVYKKQFLLIEKLKKKLKKYKLNPMISSSSSGEVNSSENRNTALPLEAERSQPQKNISDSDTGEHVSASGQNSNGRCEVVKPLGARPKTNASGPSSTSSSLVSENTVDESVSPETSICESSSEDIPSEASEKSSIGSETLKDVQKTENFEVVAPPESSNEDQNVESLLIPCNFCFEEISITTKTAVNLANHLEKEHKIVICPVCGQLFNSDVPPRYLNYHIEDHFKM
ncbi:SKICH domain-containing protein [Trichonephila inaurata madagascariensis]|uniref:SKICH domain-containing protein n=1 Tax=Trichonephila inaurata madagascariensis TaxID=2747483 RepID=A0A8X6IQV6_9ARAC|nr:SKICH domain-containing protein [Trichonephila inaurata madagascariensis]